MDYEVKIIMGNLAYEFTEMSIKSSLPFDKVAELYKEGSAKLNVNLYKYCRGYEDRVIPKSAYEVLKAVGLREYLLAKDAKYILDASESNLEEAEDSADGNFNVHCGIYFLIWMFIAEQGDKNKGNTEEWVWDLFYPKENIIRIGGNGLFS